MVMGWIWTGMVLLALGAAVLTGQTGALTAAALEGAASAIRLALGQQMVSGGGALLLTLAFSGWGALLALTPHWQAALALGVSAWIVALLRRHTSEFRLSLALTMVLGGALGNVIDRIRFGAVVDFVQWHVAGFYWPAFNVADSAITLGAVLLVWDQLVAKPSHR